jgi:hypothetical protein
MIRNAIKKRMNELKLTTNQLSVMLKGKIPRRTIYNFLSDNIDARTEVASEIMEVLGLELTPKKGEIRHARFVGTLDEFIIKKPKTRKGR